MSQYFLMGGFIGFCLAFALSFLAGSSIHVALRNGMIGCIFMALLFQYFVNRFMNLLVQNKMRELDRLEQELDGEGGKES